VTAFTEAKRPLQQVDGLRLAARYLPAARAAEVGGALYDAFAVSSACALVIGDAAVHGSAATTASRLLRSLLRTHPEAAGAGPAALLTAVDAAMTRQRSPVLATAVVAHLEPAARSSATGLWRLRWSNAGHFPPLLVREDGSVTVLVTWPDLLLGVFPDRPRTQNELLMEPGSTLLMFTDGLVEGPGRPLDEGLEALVSAVHDLARPPARAGVDDLCDAVLARLLPRGGGDEVAMLAVSIPSADP
jgi:two-component system, chemotaxis family, sensor kinase Cph1